MVRGIESVVILLPDTDIQLIEFCETKGMNTFGGSEFDVRDRYRKAARQFGVDIVVRATGDNPCVDPMIAQDTISEMLVGDADLISYSNLPLGIAIEAFQASALFSDIINPQPTHFEHVSLHIKQNPEQFKVVHLNHPVMEPYGDRPPRLTVDTIEDVKVVRKVFSELGTDFTTVDIMKLYRARPDFFLENSDIKQRSYVPEFASRM